MDEPKEWCPYCCRAKCICQEMSEMFPEEEEVEEEKPEDDCHD
jgi:hypothetical protein